jgi:hypothetical protein
MPQPNVDADRARAAAEARARLHRLAAEPGVQPLSFDELFGDEIAGDSDKEDVDDFLALRREWRTEEHTRTRE